VEPHYTFRVADDEEWVALEASQRKKITVIAPGFSTRHWWEKPLHNRDALRLRNALKVLPAVAVVDFTYDLHADAH
jgi:hypothetical protein